MQVLLFKLLRASSPKLADKHFPTLQTVQVQVKRLIQVLFLHRLEAPLKRDFFVRVYALAQFYCTRLRANHKIITKQAFWTIGPKEEPLGPTQC